MIKLNLRYYPNYSNIIRTAQSSVYRPDNRFICLFIQANISLLLHEKFEYIKGKGKIYD